jgi:hypothetical protein
MIKMEILPENSANVVWRRHVRSIVTWPPVVDVRVRLSSVDASTTIRPSQSRSSGPNLPMPSSQSSTDCLYLPSESVRWRP